MFVIFPLRRFLGNQPVPVRKSKRSFSAHSFLQRFFEPAFANLMLRERQRFLREYARQINRIHSMTETHLYANLSPAKTEDPDITLMGRKTLAGLPELSRELGGIKTDEFATAANQRILDGREQIFEIVRTNWTVAGSTILSDSDFNGRKSQSHWKDLGEDFHDVKTSWLRHLDGEIKDWKRDNDLLLLKIRVSRICKETLKTVDIKMNEEIRPTFIEPGGVCRSRNLLNKPSRIGRSVLERYSGQSLSWW